MNSEYLCHLFEYNYWRNQKIIGKLPLLQAWQLVAPTTFPHISMHGTLLHTMGAEWLWFERMCKGNSPTALPTKQQFPTVESVLERWREVEKNWRDWVNGLTDADLKATRTYTLLDKSLPAVTDPLSLCLAHVVNHGTQHCSEMAQMLTDWGQSPGNIDLLYYLREKK